MKDRTDNISMGRIFFIGALWLGLATEAVAQARFTSNVQMHHLGQVEWKHPASVQYVITNTGTEPLVLTEVEPDCACTAAQWTQEPIAPGERGTVEVTFDAEALGHFQKSVAIFTNAEPHVVYLTFDGEVVTEITDYARTHPYLIGQIRLDRDELAFPDVRQGEHPTLHIDVVNQSGVAYEPVLMHLPSYVTMTVEPGTLQPGERGRLSLTLDAEQLPGLGLTQTSVYLSRFLGDKVGAENEIPLSVVKLPDFSTLSEAERLNAPTIQLSAEELDFSVLLAQKKRARQDITITNTGRSALHIGPLQVFHPAVSVSLKKTVLQPGESTRMRVTVNRRHIGKQRRPFRLLMITNDVNRPKVEINIKTR